MSDKALLVLDMPDKCEKCPFCDFVDYACGVFGELGKNYTYEVPEEGIADWCPLKPVPEKVNLDTMRQELIDKDCYDDTNGIDEAYLQGKEVGWNDCIDKILEGCKNEID